MSLFDPISAPGCGCDAAHPRLASVPVALTNALACVPPVTRTEILPLHLAMGRVLSAPVHVQTDLPRFDCAAMDGYAMRFDDASLGTLPLCGVAAAGQAPDTLRPGTVMRIFTGAPLPHGADTVVMQENTETAAKDIVLARKPVKGSHIRRRGEDQRTGGLLIEARHRLDALSIGNCASAGVGRVQVLCRPKVSILVTGDELTAPGTRLTEAAIWDVNGPMIQAALTAAGCDVVDLIRLPDDPDLLCAALFKLARRNDMIVTSGGASVGDRDHLSGALKNLGAQVHVSGIAVKPGKPTTVASISGTPLLALPGNPLAAFTMWQVFGRAMTARLSGARSEQAVCRHIRITQSLRHTPGRCEFRPARIAGYGPDGIEYATCSNATHSARLSQALTADGFVLLPAECDGLSQGDMAEFLPFQ
ncbi:molybdopterin molybdotransferase MoeA [Roseovarius pelagicus]|uniref:Molybdopterin molybdenumtransferase n=1 Tax=Roseovarius pelagicus TaxID=2980108 RepID=A0ABY6DGB8_9RHOB|nr:gephyrin-like molybdotransferase Glp [Roseovarius pelagicus]UXX84258.1 molybdopterin molybdotransferase MoeA [Roseovarius pelagicus]